MKMNKRNIKWVILVVVFLLLGIYFAFFNTKFKVEGSEQKEIWIEKSTALFVHIPDTYQGEAIENVSRYSLIYADECPNLQFAYIASDDSLFVKNPFGIGGAFSFILHDDWVELARYNGEAEEVVVPEYIFGKPVRVIGKACFYNSRLVGNHPVKHVVLHDKVEVIGEDAFGACFNLESVTGASSVKEIGINCFNSCRNLSTVELGNQVEHIRRGAFFECKSLTAIEEQKHLISIDEYAFGCTGFEEFNFNEGVEIAPDAFKLTPWYEKYGEENDIE